MYRIYTLHSGQTVRWRSEAGRRGDFCGLNMKLCSVWNAWASFFFFFFKLVGFQISPE